MVPGSLLDAAEERLPTTPGTCVLTAISTISSRLAKGRTGQPIPGSGSAVTFTNKGYQVYIPKNRPSCIREEATRFTCV
jgi:hypothetical protein